MSSTNNPTVASGIPADAKAAACPLTVYYDGSCPMCRSEISFYQVRDGAEAITWVDVSAVPAGIEVAPGLTKADAMERFHVRDGSGQLVSGAAAFATLWTWLPAFRLAGRVAALPGIRHGLELAYRGFLPVRPWLQRRFRAKLAAKAARDVT